MKVTVVGASAIGSLLAAALIKSGFEVSLLARGATYDGLRSYGMRIISQGKDDEVLTMRDGLLIISDPAEAGRQDVLVIAVKAQVLPGLASLLRPLIADRTMVLYPTNGLPWWFLNGSTSSHQDLCFASVDPERIVS